MEQIKINTTKIRGTFERNTSNNKETLDYQRYPKIENDNISAKTDTNIDSYIG